MLEPVKVRVSNDSIMHELIYNLYPAEEKRERDLEDS